MCDPKDFDRTSPSAGAARPVAPCVTHSLGRRQFVGLGLLGAATFAAGFAPGGAQAGGNARALMLSCMDYRLVDDLTKMMETAGLHDNYDHVVLAGASLGAVHEKFADWHDTFWQHLDIARQLHQIEQVIVIDHRDCGAYRLALGEAAVDSTEKETQMHQLAIREFALRVKARHPDLHVAGYLMALDGSAEEIVLDGAA